MTCNSVLEKRALAFFRGLVAPNMNGPLANTFWTCTVPMMAETDLAVTHALIALASLYEYFSTMPAWKVASNMMKWAVAIHHYNTAITAIAFSPKQQRSTDTVLVVCALFICIEFLRGDPQSAILHSAHGVQLLNSMDHSGEVAAIFQHLSIVPYFFGADISTFPILKDGKCKYRKDIDRCQSVAEVEYSLDPLLYRCAKLVRSVDFHRFGIGTELMSLESAKLQQQEVIGELDQWWKSFIRFRTHYHPPPLPTTPDRQQQQHQYQRNTPALALLEMRWLIARIWSSTFLATDESVYDEHVDKFRRVVDTAVGVQQQYRGRQREGSFCFSIGFGPLLYFAAIKCRFLEIRLAALSAMNRLFYKRETLWDQPVRLAIAKRVVEFEHNIQISFQNGFAVPRQGGDFLQPADTLRFAKDELLEKSVVEADGVTVMKIKVRFIVVDKLLSPTKVVEWLTL